MTTRLMRVLAVLVPVAAGCGGDDAPNLTPPVLSTPFVDPSRIYEVLAYGATLGSGVINPTIEVRTDSDTLSVFASTPGRVVQILQNTQADFEVHTQDRDAGWLVIYDHVTQLAVNIGDDVGPGTRLGRIGPWGSGPLGTAAGRVELMIVELANTTGQAGLAACPLDFGTPSFVAAMNAAAAAATPPTVPCLTHDRLPG